MKSWDPTATNSSLPSTATSRLSPGSSPPIPLISRSVLSQALAREGRSARPPFVTSRKRTNARGASSLSPTNRRPLQAHLCAVNLTAHCRRAPCCPGLTDHGGDCIAVGGHARSATSGRLRRDPRRDRGLDLLARRGREGRMLTSCMCTQGQLISPTFERWGRVLLPALGRVGLCDEKGRTH